MAWLYLGILGFVGGILGFVLLCLYLVVLLVYYVLLRPVMRTGFNPTLIVNHIYRLKVIGRAHLYLERRFAIDQRHPYHSRFADLRLDMKLATGGRASVHTIPVLSNNLAYLVVGEPPAPGAPRPACVVDPCDADAVFRALPAIREIHYGGEELDISAILTTHWHWDHAGGNQRLQELLCKKLRVYGGKEDAVLACTDVVRHGEGFDAGGVGWVALAMPGHTRGSVAYCLRGEDGRDCLMTGDAFFCGGGCGAPFEACKGELERNIITVLRECDDKTLVFPGHEYTQMLLNQSSASSAPPGIRLALVGARHMADHRRDSLEHEELLTVPITLGEERQLQIASPPGRKLCEQANKVLAVLSEKGTGGSSARSTEDNTTCPDSDEDATDIAPTKALVISHNDPPRLNPFVSLYKSDFDRLCGRLEALSDTAAANLRGADVAAIAKELRDSVLRTDRDLDSGMAAETTLPSTSELQQALRVLGVSGEHSIGQEAEDLDAVPVSRGCLLESLSQMRGKDRLAVATRLLAETWKDDDGDTLPVAQVAKRLRKAAADRAAAAAEGEERISCSPCKALRNALVHCVKCRCCKAPEPLSEPLLRKRLCRPPRHDVANCTVCTSTLPVLPVLPKVKVDPPASADPTDIAQPAGASLAPGPSDARDLILRVSGDEPGRGDPTAERPAVVGAAQIEVTEVGTV